jgi:hypothetical protein
MRVAGLIMNHFSLLPSVCFTQIEKGFFTGCALVALALLPPTELVERVMCNNSLARTFTSEAMDLNFS